MNSDDYDLLAELLERFFMRSIANGMTAEYVRLSAEMEQRGALRFLDHLSECAGMPVILNPEVN